jgi:hypothetical protein
MVPPIEEIPLQSAGYRIGGTQSGHAESHFEAVTRFWAARK